MELQRSEGDARGLPPYGELKAKDLIGIPWMVAFALRADGWYLRSDIIWAKPNPMPESVTDRPTKAHEYLFLLSKGPRYFWDADAIREAHEMTPQRRNVSPVGQRGDDYSGQRGHAGMRDMVSDEPTTFGHPAGRNKRSVWTVATQPYAGAHFATFPPKLIEPCILAGSPPKCCGVCGAPWQRIVEREPWIAANGKCGCGVVHGTNKSGNDAYVQGAQGWARDGRAYCSKPASDVTWESTCTHQDDDTGRPVVLDPFAGAGTVGVVCGWHDRDFVGIELNASYAQMARDRIALEGRPGGKPSGHERPDVHDDQLGFEEVA